MKVPTLIQNRLVTNEDIGFVRELIEQNPSWCRTQLSRELAQSWNWRNAKGRLKDIACRSLLRKLDKKGLISLPAPIGLVELINHRVGGQMEVKPGLIVAGMIQDTLSGRTPLYHLERFFEDQDIEILLGESVPVSDFGDHNVGRVLDRIAEIGASKIFGEIARRAAVIFDLDTRCGHWDSKPLG